MIYCNTVIKLLVNVNTWFFIQNIHISMKKYIKYFMFNKNKINL